MQFSVTYASQSECVQNWNKCTSKTSLALKDLGDGQFSERCNVDGSFFNSDAIPIIFGKA